LEKEFKEVEGVVAKNGLVTGVKGDYGKSDGLQRSKIDLLSFSANKWSKLPVKTNCD
jgi:hypothetical protein